VNKLTVRGKNTATRYKWLKAMNKREEGRWVIASWARIHPDFRAEMIGVNAKRE